MAVSLLEDPILHTTCGLVLFSLIVQILSIGRFFKADQLKQLPKPAS